MKLVMLDGEYKTQYDSTSWKLIRSRAWFMTWNNYTEEDFTNTVNTLELLKCKYVLGREVGDEKETPHIQGCFKFEEARNAGYVCDDLFPKAYIRKCHSWKGSQIYCGKDKNYVSNIVIPEKTVKQKKDIVKPPTRMEIAARQRLEEDYDEIVWKPWQQTIIDHINLPPPNREILWCWEEKGDIGKSWIGDYLVYKYDFLTVSGKQADIFCGIKAWNDDNKELKGIVIDIPRAQESMISYTAIERLKGHFVFSSKYESGMIMMPRLHVIVFANFPPQSDKVSADRWKIIDLNSYDNSEVPVLD